MFISSVVASKLNYQAVTDKVQSASTLGYLMIASTVLIIAILFASNYNWRNLYALAVCIVTLLLCALLVFLESRGSEAVKKMQLPILSFFALIWLFVVIFCKYRDCFTHPTEMNLIQWRIMFSNDRSRFFSHPFFQ